MKKSILFLLGIYRRYISRDTGIFRKRTLTCVFYPTCSAYAEEAIEKYGALKGGYLSIRRVARCHPWQKEHIDPVP